MSKIIVIGANHAGTAAIRTLQANYPENEITVYDRNSNISFLGCGMALWIGNQISKPDGLFYADKSEFEANGAKVHMEAEVEKIDFENKKVFVKLKDGSRVEDSYDKLIMATGSLPIIPDIPGKDYENVQQVKLFQNAQEVIEKLKNPDIKDIVVVGAGYIGVELAEAFERHNKNVTIVDIADTCLPSYYDKPFTDLMKNNLAEHGINLEFNQAVKEIKGTNGKVSSVITDKKEIKADMVILSIGFRPNNALGKDKLELF